jgi:hypothetical protein
MIREMIGGYRASQALVSGIELGVFDALVGGPLTPDALAQRLGLPLSSLRRLLIFLCARGLLEKRGEAYANAPAADIYLVSNRPASLAGGVRAHKDLYTLYAYLSDAIREDSNRRRQAFPDRDQDTFAARYRDPTFLRSYHATMAWDTTPMATALCRVFDFGAARCLLDVGGGSGALAATVLQAFPHLRGITFDLPAVAPLAQESIAAAGLAGRLAVASGDMFNDEFPSGADVITLSWIVHDWDDTRALGLLRRCHAALEAGGAVLLLEALLDDDGTGPLGPAELSLTMLVATQGGRERSAAEYRALLREAGFTRSELRRLPDPQGRQCVVGWKA